MVAHRVALALALGMAAACLAPAARAQGPQLSRLERNAVAFQVVSDAFNKADGKVLGAAAGNNTDYITVKESGSSGEYIAPSCIALWSLMMKVNGMQGSGSKFKKIVVNLPCIAGSAKIKGSDVAWATPDYKCLLVSNATAATGGNIGAWYNPGPKVGGSFTLKAYVKGKNCDVSRGIRPIIYGGVDHPLEVPIIALGYDLINATSDADTAMKSTVTIKDVIVSGSDEQDGDTPVRPVIAAGNLKKLTVTNTVIKSGKGSYMGAGAEIIDSKTTFSCTSNLPCSISGCRTSALTAAQANFPGAGGGLAILAKAVKGSVFRSSYLNFDRNFHGAIGGAWYLWKQQNAAVTVTMKNSAVTQNVAGQFCSGAAVVRSDGFIASQLNDKKAPETPGKKLTLSLITPGPSFWSGNTILNQTNTDNDRVVLCGMRDLFTLPLINGTLQPMPYDTKQKTIVKVKALAATQAFVPFNPSAYATEFGYYQI